MYTFNDGDYLICIMLEIIAVQNRIRTVKELVIYIIVYYIDHR